MAAPSFKKRLSTDFIAIHCSATPPTMDIGVAEIRKWHKQKGWLDIGYHLVIRRDGIVETGRDINVQGAHVQDYNHNSIGVCLVGGIAALTVAAGARSQAENNFTHEQFLSLTRVLDTLKTTYPTAVIQGHRDFPRVAKDCPSFDVRQWLTVQQSFEIVS